MFYRVGQLEALDDPLYHTNLPNVRGEPGHYGSQRVCLRYRLPGLWEECLKLHGETPEPIKTADEVADILYRLPVGY
jgi:hypothetical protein